MKFKRVSDDILRDAGWEPEWIVQDEDEEGPFAVCRIKTLCRCCGHETSGWTVLDLASATGSGPEWSDDNGEVNATEHAAMLNNVWVQGHWTGLNSSTDVGAIS